MKIMNIALRNLNSLAGGWNIDLTNRAYENGIFVITGPTGAGKTTILDAICLALYGSTPRIKVTKSSNEVMTRGERECMAEVTFQTRQGIFRSAFSQERARGKKGSLKGGERAIFSSGGNTAAEGIEALTGLTFDQFKRAVVLPQGEFTAFLNAEDKDRIAILEKITSTEIYGKISTKVYEMYQESREKLKLLDAEIAAMGILGEEETTAIAVELQSKKGELAEIGKILDTVEKGINWQNAIHTLKQRLAALSKDALDLAREEEAFAPDREKIELARAAAPLQEIYGRIEYIFKDIMQAEKSKSEESSRQENLLNEKKKVDSEWDEAASFLARCENELESNKPVFAKIREMDGKISQIQKDRNTAQEEYLAIEKKLAVNSSNIRDMSQQQQTQTQIATELEKWSKVNARDGDIERDLGILRAAFGEIAKKKEELEQSKTVLENTRVSFSTACEKVSLSEINLKDKKKLRDDIAAQLSRVDEARKKLLGDDSLDGLRGARDALIEAKIRIDNVARLENERSKLKTGEPCPLCGSIHHPYVEAGLPRVDPIAEQLQTLEGKLADITASETKIRALEKELEKYNKAYNEAEKDALGQQANRQRAEDAKTGAENALAVIARDLSAREDDLRKAILPYANTVPDSLADALKLLERRSVEWKKNQEELERVNAILADLTNSEKILKGLAADYSRELQVRKDQYEIVEKNLADIKATRESRFGSINPDTEETALENAVKKARKEESDLKNRRDNIEKSLAEIRGRMGELDARLAQNKADLEPLQSRFNVELAESPFMTEMEFKRARLERSVKESLEKKVKDLEGRKNANRGAISTTEQELKQEEAKDITEYPLEDLLVFKDSGNKKAASLRERLGFLKAQLEENDKKLEEFHGRVKEREKIEVEERRLRKLSDFIGSKAGLSFNRRAQNITFGAIVHYANEHLARLSNRYQLVQHPTKAFVLEVADAEQFGEPRPIATLSGGETFLVSLALALGLSRMASNNAPLDSLFLDEGFGTLDKDSLDIAIEALRNLRNEGKMIGIITHVEDLKRLPAIEIVKKGGGRSEIFGEGCSRL